MVVIIAGVVWRNGTLQSAPKLINLEHLPKNESAINLRVIAVSPENRQITADVSLAIGRTTLGEFVDEQNDESLRSEVDYQNDIIEGRIKAVGRHLSSAITVTIDGSTMSFPLETLLDPTIRYLTRRVTFSVEFDPTSYPNDNFQLNASTGAPITWSVPSGVALVPHSLGRRSAHALLQNAPFQMTIASSAWLNMRFSATVDPNVTGYSLAYSDSPLVGYVSIGAVDRRIYSARGLYGRTLDLKVRPDLWICLYTYGLAACPLILGAIVIDLWRRAPGSISTSVTGVLLPLAAVSLTVLPLRAVLVPSYITGLTRVDLILGIDIAMLVCASVYVYARTLARVDHG
jgi:hypothetical protein